MKIGRDKTRFKTTSLTVLLVSAFLLSALAGIGRVSALDYTQYTGTLNGAGWALRIPNPWNGMLVLVCRGYSGSGLPNALTSLASGTAMLNSGFAIAASNYGATGLCIFEGMNSTHQLTQYIVNTYHVTGKVFLFGMSMGGCISLLLAEKYPDVYSGVLDLFGLKDLKDAYTISLKWSNLSDADLATELTKLGIPVPPPGISVSALRSFMALVTNDTVLATGGTPTTQPKAYEDRSPTYHADIEIPVITVQGTADPLVLFSQSLKYQTEVAKAGRSYLYRLYSVAGAGHGTADIIAEAPAHFDELVGWSNALDAWNMTVDGRSLKAYPDLKETIWQKNATMPPNGQYDKIGLHRLVKTGITPKGVVFLTNCPTWGTGEQRISNPASDSWTKYENFSQAIYWANRGFDVYAIDYRTHFVPKTMNASQMSFAANWGLDVWVSDIKEAAEKVKAVSGSDKFFISGECTGGMAALNYATKYWKTDLKGIILLDANFFSVGYPVVGRINETNTVNLTSTISSMNAAGTWSYNPYGTFAPVAAYALQNPGAPAEYPPGTPVSLATNPLTNKTWANISDWFYYQAQYNFGSVASTTPAGMFTNLNGSYNSLSQVEYCFANTEFLPYRIQLEAAAMVNWVNCPYLTYDYNDHYNEIGVPLLAFESGLFSNRTGTLRFVNGINNTDFNGVMLKDYGHMDLFFGSYSARDVSQPALDWMLGLGTRWSKTYGWLSGAEIPDGNIFQTSDGGYIVSGRTSSVGAGSYDAWLVKVDSSGNMQWNKTYGGPQDDRVQDMCKTSDGGYALCCLTNSFGAGSADFWLIKTDGSGNVQWNKTYGGASSETPFWIAQTSDGGYAMLGNTNSYGAGGTDFWLVKTDSSGNMQWNKTYGGTGSETGYQIIKTIDGGFALVGATNSFGAGGNDVWLIKTDAAGTMQWNKTYGGSAGDSGMAVFQTADGGYTLAALTSSYGAGGSDAWLVRTDAAGTMQWNKTYGGNATDYALHMSQTQDGGYVISGYTASFGAGGQDAWLLKTDASGNKLWDRTYGGVNNDQAWSLAQTSDGGYIVAAMTESLGYGAAGAADMLLVKTDAAGFAPAPPVPPLPHSIITVAQAYNMIYSGLYPNLLIIDVRSAVNFGNGHIPGALNVPVMPPSTFNFTALYAWINSTAGQSNKNNPIIVYCGTGAASNQTSYILDANGFINVFDMSAAYPGWVAAGYPVVKALSAAAYCNVTVLPGWSWWFFAQPTGGTAPYTYQWYEGTALLTGQTSMVLQVTKNSPGVYSYYCKVTDKDGSTTNSNTVTLTVAS